MSFPFSIQIFIGLVISFFIIRLAKPKSKLKVFVYSLIPLSLYVASAILLTYLFGYFYSAAFAANWLLSLILSSIAVPYYLYKKMKNGNRFVIPVALSVMIFITFMSSIVTVLRVIAIHNIDKKTEQTIHSIIRDDYLEEFKSKLSPFYTYRNGDDYYDISETERVDFERKFPNSERIFIATDTTYSIPVCQIDSFLNTPLYEMYWKELFSRRNNTIYGLKGNFYSIPQNEREVFERDYPEAKQIYKLSNDKLYVIPLEERAMFEQSPEYKKDREEKRNIAYYVYKGIEYEVPKKDVEEFEKIVPESKRYYKGNKEIGNVLIPLKNRKSFEKKHGLVPKSKFEQFIDSSKVFLYNYWGYIAISLCVILLLVLIVQFGYILKRILSKYNLRIRIWNNKKIRFENNLKESDINMKSFYRFKIAVIIALLCLLYLFALNGRYAVIADDSVYFDKWKCEFFYKKPIQK